MGGRAHRCLHRGARALGGSVEQPGVEPGNRPRDAQCLPVLRSQVEDAGS